MRFEWIERHQQEFVLSALCAVLNVCRSGYYAWRKRPEHPPTPRRQRRDELVRQVRDAHGESRGTYGSPRVHA